MTISTSLNVEKQRLTRALGSVVTGLSLSPTEATAHGAAAGWITAQLGGAAGDEIAETTRTAESAISAAGSLPVGSGAGLLVGAIRAASQIQQLPGVVRVGARRGVHAYALGLATGAVVNEGAAAPLGQLVAASVDMTTIKTVATLVCTSEVARATNAVEAFGMACATAAAGPWDAAVLAALPAVATVHAASTSLTDLDAAFVLALADLEQSVGSLPVGVTWMFSRAQIARLMAVRGTGGAPAWPSLPGSLFGVPVLATSWPTGSTGALIAPGSIIVSDNDLLEVSRSDQASLEFSSAPTGSAITPTATSLVSLWATNAIAIKASYIGQFGANAAGVVKVTGLF